MTSAEFAEAMYRKRQADFGDLVRVISMLAFDEEAEGPFETLHERLVGAGIAPDFWEYSRQEPVTRGDVALLMARALRLRGGLLSHVFGWTRRSAHRACADVGVLKRGSPTDRISGRELLGTLQRAEDYLEDHASLTTERSP